MLSASTWKATRGLPWTASRLNYFSTIKPSARVLRVLFLQLLGHLQHFPVDEGSQITYICGSYLLSFLPSYAKHRCSDCCPPFELCAVVGISFQRRWRMRRLQGLQSAVRRSSRSPKSEFISTLAASRRLSPSLAVSRRLSVGEKAWKLRERLFNIGRPPLGWYKFCVCPQTFLRPCISLPVYVDFETRTILIHHTSRSHSGSSHH